MTSEASGPTGSSRRAGDRDSDRSVRVRAAQLLRLRHAQRRRAAASPSTSSPDVRGPSSRSIAGSRAGRASPTAGSCARSSTRSWPGRSSARTTGASRRGCPSSSGARSRSGGRSAPRAGSPASRRRVVDTAGRIVDSETGVELATATGVYVAAGAARKRDLRERYAYRPAGPTDPADSVDATRRDDAPRPAQSAATRAGGRLRRRPPRAGRGPRRIASPTMRTIPTRSRPP